MRIGGGVSSGMSRMTQVDGHVPGRLANLNQLRGGFALFGFELPVCRVISFYGCVVSVSRRFVMMKQPSTCLAFAVMKLSVVVSASCPVLSSKCPLCKQILKPVPV